MDRPIGSNEPARTAREVVIVDPETGAPAAPLVDGGEVTLGAGDANIGNVDIASALPAGTNHVGQVAVDGYTNAAYETVAASQTDQMLGATGAAGDFLAGLLVIPATTSPGEVRIEDGAISNVVVFTGGADSVSNLVPFWIPIGANSVGGGWEVTTGASVSVIAIGNFT